MSIPGQLKQALREAQEQLVRLDEMQKTGRIYSPDGTRMPPEIFQLKDVCLLLIGIVAAQQEELEALKGKMR